MPQAKDRIDEKDALSPKVKLYVPELPLVYRAKKVYLLLQRIDKKMQKNPSFVSIKDYLLLVEEYEKISQELISRGWHTGDGRAKARVAQKRLDRTSHAKSEAGVGETEPGSVGTGVSATNPFA